MKRHKPGGWSEPKYANPNTGRLVEPVDGVLRGDIVKVQVQHCDTCNDYRLKPFGTKQPWPWGRAYCHG